MIVITRLPLLFLTLFSCQLPEKPHAAMSTLKPAADRNPYKTIGEIPLPQGFHRTAAASGSFSAFLRKTGLKASMTVHLFNGKPKMNQSAHFALLDIPVGETDLQQCADAVMRLRAEYLYAQKDFTAIVFYDNERTPYRFTRPYTNEHFAKYLRTVFEMCGSASLSKQLKPVPEFTDIRPGDVIIRGGFPGHAVIVMDVAMNADGEKVYLLAQSYMPAQDIHVLKNPAYRDLSPWYRAGNAVSIHTPEYSFRSNELKRW